MEFLLARVLDVPLPSTLVEDVVRKSFATARAVETWLASLQGVPGARWDALDGADGRYLRGLTSNGVKIRLVPLGERALAEIFFPVGPGWTRFDDDEKRAFVEWTTGTVLAAIGASDVRDPLT